MLFTTPINNQHKFTKYQTVMLQLSDEDITMYKLISKEQLDLDDLEWLEKNPA